jgi:hypothetical protein
VCVVENGAAGAAAAYELCVQKELEVLPTTPRAKPVAATSWVVLKVVESVYPAEAPHMPAGPGLPERRDWRRDRQPSHVATSSSRLIRAT